MIAVFLANGFEEVEALTPVDFLRRLELDVKTVGVGGRMIRGSHHIPVVCDMTTDELSLDILSGILLPGGMPGTLNLEKDETVIGAIRYSFANQLLVGAICAAPSVLGHLGLLKGRKATCFTGFEGELEGAEVLSDPVVTDGNLITSRGAGTASLFAFALGEKLTSKERVGLLKAGILWQ